MSIINTTIMKYICKEISGLESTDTLLSYKGWWVFLVHPANGELYYRTDLTFALRGKLDLKNPNSLDMMITSILSVISQLHKIEANILESGGMKPAFQYG